MLLLAAGRSRRFRGDKLMTPLADGRPLVLHSLAPYLRIMRQPVAHSWQSPNELLVVCRPAHHALHALLNGLALPFTICPGADQGMGHSLAWGASQMVRPGNVLVGLADMPHVRAATVARVGNALAGGALIARPVLRLAGEPTKRLATPGHPVGFSARLHRELTGCSGDQGAQALLRRHRAGVVRVPVADPGILADVDTRAALENLPGMAPTPSCLEAKG